MQNKTKSYLNEDYFWNKYRYLDKETKDRLIHLTFSITSSAERFVKQGKLSKITSNRIKEGLYRLWWDSDEKPSDWVKRMEKHGYKNKKIDMYLFKNAMDKFLKLSKKENHKHIKEKVKWWEELKKDKGVSKT